MLSKNKTLHVVCFFLHWNYVCPKENANEQIATHKYLKGGGAFVWIILYCQIIIIVIIIHWVKKDNQRHNLQVLQRACNPPAMRSLYSFIYIYLYIFIIIMKRPMSPISFQRGGSSWAFQWFCRLCRNIFCWYNVSFHIALHLIFQHLKICIKFSFFASNI